MGKRSASPHAENGMGRVRLPSLAPEAQSAIPSYKAQCVDLMSPGREREGERVRLFFEVVLEPGLGPVVLARSAEPHLMLPIEL
jgi:hypothetical protein